MSVMKTNELLVITSNRFMMDDRSVLLCEQCLSNVEEDENYSVNIKRHAENGCTHIYTNKYCNSTRQCDKCEDESERNCPLSFTRVTVTKIMRQIL